MSEDNDKSSKSTLRSFKDLFRRRHRSSVSSGGVSESDDISNRNSPSLEVTDKSQDVTNLVFDCKTDTSYGHYATVSGTGANLLKDLFQRKYQSSIRTTDLDAAKPRKDTNVRVRFKADDIIETTRLDTKGKKENVRTRHISVIGSPEETYRTYSGGGSGSSGLGYPKLGSSKVRGIFDSIRLKNKSSEYIGVGVQPGFNAYSTLKEDLTIGKKKKKFKVTKADDTSRTFGPDQFFQMYQERTISDAKKFDTMRSRRASTSTLPARSKANTIHSYEPLHLVIWRDKKAGTRIFRLPKTYTKNLEFEDANDLMDSEELLLVRFMNAHPCYEAMPNSTKLVILDIQLKVKKAFYALLLNGLHSAPLWCSDLHDTVGMLTISDFISILYKYHNDNQLKIEDLEEQRIISWKEMIGKKCTRDCTIEVGPDATLLDAVSKLRCNAVHRVLVSEPSTGNALFILTYKNLLRHIFPYINSLNGLRVDFLSKTIGQLKVGSYDHMHAVTYDHHLIDVIKIFHERNISSLPVINHAGQVIDVYSKFDIFSLALDSLYTDLNISIKKALVHRREDFEGLHTCVVSERFITIISRFVNTGAHRIFVVSDRKELKGVISLSDIIDFLVSKPFSEHQERTRKISAEAETKKLDSLLESSPTNENQEVEASANQLETEKQASNEKTRVKIFVSDEPSLVELNKPIDDKEVFQMEDYGSVETKELAGVIVAT